MLLKNKPEIPPATPEKPEIPTKKPEEAPPFDVPGEEELNKQEPETPISPGNEEPEIPKVPDEIPCLSRKLAS